MKIQIPAGGWQPRARQLRLWSYLERGGRHAVAVWPRRYGKDELALRWTSVAMIKRPGNYWHMLPEASQARKAIWNAINPHTGKRRIEEAFPQELRKTTRENEMFIGFGQSTWQVVGSDNFDSLMGSPPVGIIYSEWPLASPSAAAYLRPIIAENKGWELYIYTPRGRNHGLSTYQGAQKDSQAFAELLTVDQTKHISTETLAKELAWYKGEYGAEDGEAFYRQEYFCDFNAPLVGAILGRYVERAEREGRISNDVRYDREGAPIEISSDIGFRDTASWWFWQPKVGGYSLIDYDQDRGVDADDWIERIRSKNYEIGHIWLPKDAKAKTFQSKRSAMERFLQAFTGSVVRVVPADTIANRINAARRVIERCEFAESACEDGLNGLRAWAFEWDDEAKVYSKEPKHDWACFAQDTEVLTRNGTCPIMNLPENGEVLTPCGWKQYQGPRITRRNARLVGVKFKDGHFVKCTPDHMFLTASGWRSAESLIKNTVIQSCSIPLHNISMVAYIGSGLRKYISLAVGKNFIEMLGHALSAVFLPNVISTTKMEMCPTIPWTILNAFPQTNIYQGRRLGSANLPAWQRWTRHATRPQSGTHQNKEDYGTAAMPSEQKAGLNGNMRIWLAKVAARLFPCWSEKAERRKDSVPETATHALIEGVYPLSERADTCCIHVPDGECFALANGAVVHNSHPGDSFSYGAQVMEQAEAKKPREEIKPIGYTLNDLWKDHERTLARVQRI